MSELVVGSPLKWLGRAEPSDLLRSPAARLRGIAREGRRRGGGLAARDEARELLDLVTFPEDSPRQRLVALTREMTAGTVRRLIRDARG